MLTWKNWPFKDYYKKAEGCTESRSSCHRCITIYCIKALVQGLKGIAFHGNNEIILCTLNPPLSSPFQISPLPLIAPPPFSREERVSYKSPPLPPLLSRCKWQRQVACLYHHEKGPGVLLCSFHLDGMQLHCSFPYPYAIPYLFSRWSVEGKDFLLQK